MEGESVARQSGLTELLCGILVDASIASIIEYSCRRKVL